MNFSFYIIGSPNSYNQYPSDSNSSIFQEFALDNTTESQLTVCRKGQLIFYAYFRKLQEKSSDFLGFCLVFNGIYCQNNMKLFELFDKVYYDVQMKGEVLKFQNGRYNYVLDKFAEKPLEIERIKTFFKLELETNFSRDFAAIPDSFKVHSGKKKISIKEENINILTAIAEYDTLHISNNDKSLSELERAHNMLTKLYAEKQDLDTKYKKLTAQKKQYKVVLFLSLVLFACVIGLMVFNENIHTKDNQISSLGSEVNDKSNQISHLETQNYNYRSENNSLKAENQRLTTEVEMYKKYEPKSYLTTSDAYYYYKYNCNQSYERTSCYTNSGNYISIYKVENGYGLADFGWVNMSDLYDENTESDY